MVLPATEKIGVGWFSTISAAFLVVCSLATAAAVRWGEGWRGRIDRKRRVKRRKELEDVNAAAVEVGENGEKRPVVPMVVEGKEKGAETV